MFLIPNKLLKNSYFRGWGVAQLSGRAAGAWHVQGPEFDLQHHKKQTVLSNIKSWEIYCCANINTVFLSCTLMIR